MKIIQKFIGLLSISLLFTGIAQAEPITIDQTHAKALITGVYRQVLGRLPDQGGLAAYLDFVNQGYLGRDDGSIIQRMTDIARGSDEYKQFKVAHNGASAEVLKLFKDLLGRIPTVTEATLWTGELERGTSYAMVRARLADSAEARAAITSAFTQPRSTFSHRFNPTQEELDWARSYVDQGGGSLVNLRNLIEKRGIGRTALSGINPIVSFVFLRTLDREPNQAEGSNYTKFINGTETKPDGPSPQIQLHSILAASIELRNRLLNSLYVEILGRNIDPSGHETYSNFMLTPEATINRLRAIMIGSDECALNVRCTSFARSN